MTRMSLKTIRAIRGIRQSDLARELNIDRGTLSRIETGQVRETPGIIRAKLRISEFLGYSIEEIFPEQ